MSFSEWASRPKPWPLAPPGGLSEEQRTAGDCYSQLQWAMSTLWVVGMLRLHASADTPMAPPALTASSLNPGGGRGFLRLGPL